MIKEYKQQQQQYCHTMRQTTGSRTNTHTHTQTCARLHTHLHTHTLTHTHTHSHAYTHTYTHTRARTHTRRESVGLLEKVSGNICKVSSFSDQRVSSLGSPLNQNRWAKLLHERETCNLITRATTPTLTRLWRPLEAADNTAKAQNYVTGCLHAPRHSLLNEQPPSSCGPLALRLATASLFCQLTSLHH